MAEQQLKRDPSLPREQPRWLLPNQLLEAVESIAAERPKQVFRVSGETTVYRNQLYLLLRKVTVEVGGEPEPAAARAAPVRAEAAAPRVESTVPKPDTPPVVKPGAPAKAPPARGPAPRPTTRPATSRPATTAFS